MKLKIVTQHGVPLNFRMKFSKLLGWERLQKIIKTKLNRRVDEAEDEDPEAEAE